MSAANSVIEFKHDLRGEKLQLGLFYLADGHICLVLYV